MTVWNDLHGIVGRPPKEEDDEMYERRDAIARAALRVAARHGLANASMRAIAAEANMLPSGLYYHFRSKADLLEVAIVCAEDDERNERQARLPPTNEALALRLELFAAILREGRAFGLWGDVEPTLRAASARLTAVGCDRSGPGGPSRG